MNVKRVDFPADHYPIKFSAYRSDNDRCVWRATVDRPGPLHVPPLKMLHGVRVWVRVEFANGEVWTERREGDDDEG